MAVRSERLVEPAEALAFRARQERAQVAGISPSWPSSSA
jgi:hypothetical protein